MSKSSGFYLGVGSVLSESVTSKITTAQNEYVSKVLYSTPANWWKIVGLLARSDLTGAIVKLTGNDFERIFRAEYSEVAEALFKALSNKPHLLLIHEAVVGIPASVQPADDEETDFDDGNWNDRVAREHFGEVPDEVRKHTHDLLDKHGLTVSTYKRNAEASILASSFVEDSQSNLLFRFYVPSGRLYEDELARLLVLFHDWLGTVKHQTVRQGGYKTPSGRVIEFFGDVGVARDSLKNELAEFAQFLSILEDPKSAEEMLLQLGLERERATTLVVKYAKESRRVLLDTKHERDRRTLAIQQQLESELIEDLPSVSGAEIGNWVQRLVPTSPFAASSATASLVSRPVPNSSVVIHQQFFKHVEGVVAQSISGSISFGTPADELLELIREYGDTSKEALESATQELIDTGAPMSARIGARQKLKSFVARNAQRFEAAAFQTIWKWLESQIGN